MTKSASTSLIAERGTVSTQVETQGSFKDAMAHLCSPVSVITSMDDGRPHGTTVSAVMSLSMSPELILVALARSSQSLQILQRTGCFGVNLLASNQADLAVRFATKGTSKFSETRWDEVAGVPRILDAAVWISCQVFDLIDGGDHVMVIGSVGSAWLGAERPPLTYHRRRFGTHLSTVS